MCLFAQRSFYDVIFWFIFSLLDFWSFRSHVHFFLSSNSEMLCQSCVLTQISPALMWSRLKERRREKDCGIRWTYDVGSWTRRSMRKPLPNQATVASSITFSSLLLRATCTDHHRYNQTGPRQSGDQTCAAKQSHHTHTCRNVSTWISLSNINNVV